MKTSLAGPIRSIASVLAFTGFPAKVQKSIDRVGDVSLRADDLKRMLIANRDAPSGDFRRALNALEKAYTRAKESLGWVAL